MMVKTTAKRKTAPAIVNPIAKEGYSLSGLIRIKPESRRQTAIMKKKVSVMQYILLAFFDILAIITNNFLITKEIIERTTPIGLKKGTTKL
jgi:hypothetical protein